MLHSDMTLQSAGTVEYTDCISKKEGNVKGRGFFWEKKKKEMRGAKVQAYLVSSKTLTIIERKKKFKKKCS